MNYHARCSIYLRRFWTRWAAPNANRLALLLEAASPDWEPIEWKEREGLRSAVSVTEPLAKNRHIHMRSNGKLEL